MDRSPKSPKSPRHSTRTAHATQGPPRWMIAVGAAVVLLVIVVVAVVRATSSTPNAPGTVSVPTLTANSPATSIYTIDQSASTATFTIDEVLFGKPNTVVGSTNQVAGQIAINSADPTKCQVGQIKVDLTNLTTDNDRRNGAIQNFILQTSDPANQYATFTPTSITGLSQSLQIGQVAHLAITGNLTIHQTTHQVTFKGTATLSEAHALTGQFQTTVAYADYGLSIPNVPSVTGVGNTVILAINFTAKPA